jgi:hypothetical protein
VHIRARTIRHEQTRYSTGTRRRRGHCAAVLPRTLNGMAPARQLGAEQPAGNIRVASAGSGER